MNRMTRTALAGALAAAVALGAAAPAAVAAPKASHVKTDHKSAKADKHGKADRSLTAAQRRLAKEVTRKDAKLRRLAGSNKVERLDDTAEAAVVANIDADRGQLAALKEQVATSEAKDVRSGLRAIRPEVYNTIVNQLRLATSLHNQLAASADAATLTAEADPLAALLALLATYDAETARADLRAAQKVLSSIKDAVESSDDETEDPADETDDSTDSSDDSAEESPEAGTGTTAP